jgi:hypothetical protein
MLAPAEIKEAIRLCIEENGPMSAPQMTIAVSRTFGFERAGPDLKAAIEAVVQTTPTIE